MRPVYTLLMGRNDSGARAAVHGHAVDRLEVFKICCGSVIGTKPFQPVGCPFQADNKKREIHHNAPSRSPRQQASRIYG